MKTANAKYNLYYKTQICLKNHPPSDMAFFYFLTQHSKVDTRDANKLKSDSQDKDDLAAGEDRVIVQPALTSLQTLFHR